MANQYNLTGTKAIAQGATFDWLTFLVKQNFTTWQGRGQIRDNFADKGGKIKASFTVSIQFGDVIISGQTVQRSQIKPTLSATQTEGLDWIASGMRSPATDSEPLIPGRNCWVYDIELFKGDEVKRLVQGFVVVSPEVTR